MASPLRRHSARDPVLLSILLAALAMLPNGCGGKDGEEQQGATVTGEVTSTGGAPLAGVRVSRVGGTEAADTDVSGQVVLSLPADREVVLRLSRSGFVNRLETLKLPAGASSGAFSAVLLPREPAIGIPGIQGGGSAAGKHGTRVTFPAGALVNASGQAVSGDVQVTLTPIDVASGEALAFPGAYEGIPQGGIRAPIVSFGAADFEVTQGGTVLRIAPGATATIEIPLYATRNQDGSPVAVGQRIPLWSLDAQTGIWRQEGEAEVVASAGSPTGLSGRATVSHFSPWNLDQLASYPGTFEATPVKCVIGARGDLPQRDLPAGTSCTVVYTVGDGASPTEVRSEVIPPAGTAGPLPSSVPLRLDGRARVEGVLLRGLLQVTLPAGGSGPLVIVLDPGNAPPTANAGPDQTVLLGSNVQLDGTGSRDPDGNPLTFAWSVTTRPAGSGAALSDAAARSPTFVADVVGSYVVQLVVNDGKVSSAPDTVRIMAEPLPALSIDDAQVAEGDAGTGSLAFQVHLSRASAVAVTVGYVAADGTATSPGDYAAVTGTLTIPAGATVGAVTVAVVGDTAVEADETMTVTLTSPAGALISDGQATGTIVNDDQLPVVTIAATDAAASEVGPDAGTFTIARSGSTAAALTVRYAVGGTATNGADYQAIPATVTIPAGQSSAAMLVTPIADAASEGPETVVLTLVADAAYTIGTPAAATVTIADEVPVVVTIVATRPTTDESGEVLGIFTVTRTGSSAAALLVSFTVGGTATGGLDYLDIGTSVTLPAGQASVQIGVRAFGDSLVEGAETVVVSLVDGAAYDLGSPASATVTIADGPVPVVTVVATDAQAAEAGPDPGAFTISRSGGSGSPLQVTFTIGGTAASGVDYVAIPATAVIPAGQSSVNVTVTPIVDSLVEGGETVVLTLLDGANYDLGQATSATVTIVDAALPEVTVVATDAQAAEPGTNTGTFTISRTGPTASALEVNLAVGGSATAGADYQAIPATVTIPAGQSSTTVLVTPINDATTEGAETVVLTISAGASYTVGLPANATVSIADDDAPVVTIEATDASASEAGLDPGVFTIARSGPTTAGLRVSYSIGGTATNGTDYQGIASEVIIPAGQSSVAVTITPIADQAVEGSETVLLILALDLTGTYQVGSPGQATVTIADDNALPVVTIVATDATASEPGTDTGTFTITRSGPTTFSLTVFLTRGGTATFGLDYQSIANNVTIPAGQSSVAVTITPIDDQPIEDVETVILTLQENPATYLVGTPNTATVTIADDLPNTVTLVATDATASEPGTDTGTFTITRSGPTTFSLTVFLTRGGTATFGLDYQSIANNVTIPAGQSSVAVTITPIDDQPIEDVETVILTLQENPATYLVGTPNTATVTIADDLPNTVTLVATDATASEPGTDTGTFTITRSGPTTFSLTVFLTRGGTATFGLDYQSIANNVTIPAGQSSVAVTITPIDDQPIEDVETVILTLQENPATYLVGTPNTATVSIADDDAPVVTIVATDATAAEPGTDTGTFTITRSGPTTFSLTVFLTRGGTATFGLDYQSIANNVTIPAGQSSVAVTITPIDDQPIEDVETVILTLQENPATYLVGTPNTATVTIADDLPNTVTLVATDATASEPGTDTGTFTITRSGPTTFSLTVFLTRGGTATFGLDYQSIANNVTIPAGQSSVAVTITPIDDQPIEDVETVILTLQENPATYLVGTPNTATVTIADDLPNTVTLVATDATASEPGTDTGTFTITRSGPTTFSLTVFLTRGGTATFGLDYQSIANNVTIPAGQSSVAVTITPIDDQPIEDVETVILTLQENPATYLVGTPNTATVTIADDLPNTVTLVATDATASEPGTDTGTFTITRSGPTTFSLTVFLTRGGTATFGLDYQSIANNVTIPAGQSSVAVTITPIDDQPIEDVETVILTLQENPATYLVGTPNTATVTISSND